MSSQGMKANGVLTGSDSIVIGAAAPRRNGFCMVVDRTFTSIGEE
jgi:hypothetical protein